MDFIIDTSLLIEIEKRNKDILNKFITIASENRGNVHITSATYSEYFFGILKWKKDFHKNVQRLEEYDVLNTTKESSKILAQVKYDLEKKGKPIPIFDLIIASIAIDRDCILLTLDNHFKFIEKLKVVVLN